MTVRCIRLGDGRRVRLGAYVTAWKTAKALPPLTWCRRTGNGWPGTADEAVRVFRRGLHDRINRHIPGYGIGRKWSDDWQRNALQFAAQVNNPRLVIRWAPQDFRKRFSGRIEGWNI